MIRSIASRLLAIPCAFAVLGCGSGQSGEVEIVAPNASAAVLNPDPKAPMAGIDVTNEAEHIKELKQGGAFSKGR
ncbi:MAG: hypothetical protein U0800_05570 [Isosphaeraceae bacterium]